VHGLPYSRLAAFTCLPKSSLAIAHTHAIGAQTGSLYPPCSNAPFYLTASTSHLEMPDTHTHTRTHTNTTIHTRTSSATGCSRPLCSNACCLMKRCTNQHPHQLPNESATHAHTHQQCGRAGRVPLRRRGRVAGLVAVDGLDPLLQLRLELRVLAVLQRLQACIQAPKNVSTQLRAHGLCAPICVHGLCAGPGAP